MYQVEVPTGYDPCLSCFKRKTRDRWYLEYYLPSEKKVRISCSLPNNIAKNKANIYAVKKHAELLKGLLSEREYRKLGVIVQNIQMSIDQALDEYMRVTFLNKSELNKNKERKMLPHKFKYFKETLSLQLITAVKDIHLIEYKKYLLQEIQKNNTAPATAQSDLANVKKVFNWLARNKIITDNPAKDITPIKIRQEMQVRSNTFTHEQIIKIMQTPFDSYTGLNMKALFLWLRETGCRIGEALHLEWQDVQDGVWSIRYKPKCPTRFGLGWGPKWNKPRKIFLTSAAQEILNSLPKLNSVGYMIQNDEPIHANFIFVMRDNNPKNPNGWRRVDKIEKTWRSFLKKADIPFKGIEGLKKHDLRRTWNVEAKHFRGVEDEFRSIQLGNSVRVNNSNYRGTVDDEVMKMMMRIKESNGSNLIKYLKENNDDTFDKR